MGEGGRAQVGITRCNILKCRARVVSEMQQNERVPGSLSPTHHKH